MTAELEKFGRVSTKTSEPGELCVISLVQPGLVEKASILTLSRKYAALRFWQGSPTQNEMLSQLRQSTNIECWSFVPVGQYIRQRSNWEIPDVDVLVQFFS